VKHNITTQLSTPSPNIGLLPCHVLQLFEVKDVMKSNDAIEDVIAVYKSAVHTHVNGDVQWLTLRCPGFFTPSYVQRGGGKITPHKYLEFCGTYEQISTAIPGMLRPRGQIIRPRPRSIWPRPRLRPRCIWPRPHISWPRGHENLQATWIT